MIFVLRNMCIWNAKYYYFYNEAEHVCSVIICFDHLTHPLFTFTSFSDGNSDFSRKKIISLSYYAALCIRTKLYGNDSIIMTFVQRKINIKLQN